MSARRGSLRAGLAVAAVLAGPAVVAAAPAALSAEDRAAVFAAAGLLAGEAGRYRIEGCTAAFKPDIELLDLDRDGRPEVLLYLNASRCFRDSQGGGNVGLFMRDAAGRWSDRLGFAPGVEVVVQDAAHAGLPDLGVANPGGCMLIYHWDGSAYRVAAQRAVLPGGCQFRE